MFNQSYRSRVVSPFGYYSPGISTSWEDGDISDDGMIVTLLDRTAGQLIQSLDGGASWAAVSSLTTRDYSCFGQSPDGSALVVGVNGGLVYTSADTGANWATGGFPSFFWAGICIASDNVSGFAVPAESTAKSVYSTGNLFVSYSAVGTAKKSYYTVECANSSVAYAGYDNGAGTLEIYSEQLSWGLYVSGTHIFNVSSNGSQVVHAISGDKIYLNGNPTNSGNRSWSSTDVCNDGTKIVGCIGSGFTGSVYLSTNSGASYSAISALGTGDWRFVKISADGSRLIAARSSGQAYVYVIYDKNDEN